MTWKPSLASVSVASSVPMTSGKRVFLSPMTSSLISGCPSSSSRPRRAVRMASARRVAAGGVGQDGDTFGQHVEQVRGVGVLAQVHPAESDGDDRGLAGQGGVAGFLEGLVLARADQQARGVLDAGDDEGVGSGGQRRENLGFGCRSRGMWCRRNKSFCRWPALPRPAQPPPIACTISTASPGSRKVSPQVERGARWPLISMAIRLPAKPRRSSRTSMRGGSGKLSGCPLRTNERLVAAGVVISAHDAGIGQGDVFSRKRMR